MKTREQLRGSVYGWLTVAVALWIVVIVARCALWGNCT